MSHTKLVALLVMASVSAMAVAASAQELPKSEELATVAALAVASPAPRPVREPVESAPSTAAALPDAPGFTIKPLESYPKPLAFAASQQQGGPRSRGGYPNPNRRKYILIGVICAAAIVGGIIIATQRD